MKLYIDYGGTSFRYRLDNNDIKSFSSKEADLLMFVEEMLKMHKSIDFVGISFAGLVQNGKIISAPNIDIKDLDIKSIIESRYSVELEIQNDLNCAALAEFNTLNPEGTSHVESLALFYIGTGFGSAFIDDKRLILGASNKSGEIGHIPFKKTPFKCGCGRDDCLELSCSGSGIEKWCEHFGIEKKYARLDRLVQLESDDAKAIVNNFYEGLAHGFHTALNLFDFNNLILGGSVGKNLDIKRFLENEFSLSSFKRERLDIRLSSLSEGSLEGTKYL